MQFSEPAVLLDDIVITPRLAERSAPPRNILAEHEALTDLIGRAATAPSGLLQRLVDHAVDLCHAGSAGVSLLEPAAEQDGVFRWVALAGAYRHYVGGTTPQSFSPCGSCLARGTPQLYRYPARLFTYLSEATPPIVEGLVLPLRSEAGPLGTIWIVSHDEAHGFTAHDVVCMASLANFTSTALVLQHAREEAEAANRAKDEFLAVVSHELRRPLTAIVGWAELLLAGRATPVTAARAIESLHTNARRQQDMIEDLLDASRALTGSLRLHERPMDLSAVVRSAIEIVTNYAKGRNVELLALVDEPLPFQGDPDRLHQVVGNLLSNAVKFTPAGGRVSVALQIAVPWVEISVCDTGVGVAPHMAPRIFDAFRKADASSNRRDSGLGLGLTIAHRLAVLHGGTIEVQSDGVGRGALFTVRLPATRLLTESEVPPQADVRIKRNLPLLGLRILVVDDEPDMRDIHAWMLGDAGATVVTAADMESALVSMARQSFDVLVTDIVMPGHDGYDLLARIDLNRSPITTIAVTALASVRERQRILAAGFDHHVAKPVDFNALVRLIVQCRRSVGAH